ncbi:MAG: hypothetical protein L0212_03630 [Acidobacteria bacterium]|nr:hypothetical protein [Acidobacteriota bacterium]
MHEQHRDAEDIRDDDWLLRRITPSRHVAVQPDGTRILTSYAFREQSHEFSLYVAKEITHEKLLSCGFPTQEIVEVTAGEVRALGYIIVRDPDECDESHVFAKAVRYKSRSQIHRDCQTLAEAVTRRWAERRSEALPPSGQ